MSSRLNKVLELGVRYRLESIKEANKWIAIVLSIVLTPLLLAIHLPVSLLLIGEDTESLYAVMILAITHMAFAATAIYLFPPVGEIRWLLLQVGFPRLFGLLFLQHFKHNIFYWGLWIVPLPVLWYLDEPFSFPLYVFWLLSFVCLLGFATLEFALLRYRNIFVADRPFRGKLRLELAHYRQLWTFLGYFFFVWSIVEAELLLALRMILIILASILVALGANAVLERSAQARFWMHVSSCSRLRLLVDEIFRGATLIAPFLVIVVWPLELAELARVAGCILAVGILSLLSYCTRGRKLVAPFLAVAGVALLVIWE